MNAEPEHMELPPGWQCTATITLCNGTDSISQTYTLDQPIVTIVTDGDGCASIDLGKATPCSVWDSARPGVSLDPSIHPHVGDWVFCLSHGSPDGTYRGGIPRPALVTEVAHPGHPESDLTLTVFTPNGSFCNAHVRYGREPGCWNWGADDVYP